MAGTSNLSAAVDALGEMDVEVVLAAGTTDLSALGVLPGNVRSVGFLALSTFLPTCSLIVHHGGSGTTAAPLHYGIPQLVMPSFADNHMSAQRWWTAASGCHTIRRPWTPRPCARRSSGC